MLIRLLASRNVQAWSALTALGAVLATGCDRAGGATQAGLATEQPGAAALDAALSPAAEEIARLTSLRKHGELAAWIDEAIDTNDSAPSSARELIRSEALLASGRPAEAQPAAIQAATLGLRIGDMATTEQALKLWVTARWREQQPLGSADFAALLEQLPNDVDTASVLRFWREALAEKPAFRVTSNVTDATCDVPLASSLPGSLPAELNAIEVQAGGVMLPLVFIDTGAQHTLLTVEAAHSAGVRLGPGSARLVGFGGLDARPGVLDTLQIGELTIHDVPVLVGNSAPLKALKGQMALGTELMHHLRLTIDYPRRKVSVSPASTTPASEASPAIWEIPLWTFPQATLAEATLPDGQKARVLVDTGDRAGTFISARWARRNVPGFHRSNTPIVFKFKRRDLMLGQLELGNQTLVNWPVLDTLPNELERLDLVDVLVGHDVLWPYRLTIDLGQRVLWLEGEAPRRAPPRGREDATEGEAAIGEEQESQ